MIANDQVLQACEVFYVRSTSMHVMMLIASQEHHAAAAILAGR